MLDNLNLDNLTSQIKSTLSDVKSAFNNLTTGFNRFGKVASYRYPLNDVDKYENVIKFTALARNKKSSMLDFRVPEVKESALGSVVLYMPTAIAVNDNLSYDNVDTGIGGMAVNAAGSSASVGEFLGKVKENAGGIAERYVSTKLAAASQEKGLVGGAAGQALINAGQVTNPHTQMLFKAPQLRQFSFTFKMMPRTLAEAQEIVKIVKFFRAAAHPELAGGAKGDAFEMATFQFPDIFEIKYLTRGKENKNLIKHVNSYLTSVSVTYNDTAPVFYNNGMPSEVTLTLGFQESKALNRRMIWEEGY